MPNRLSSRLLALRCNPRAVVNADAIEPPKLTVKPDCFSSCTCFDAIVSCLPSSVISEALTSISSLPIKSVLVRCALLLASILIFPLAEPINVFTLVLEFSSNVSVTFLLPIVNPIPAPIKPDFLLY